MLLTIVHSQSIHSPADTTIDKENEDFDLIASDKRPRIRDNISDVTNKMVPVEPISVNKIFVAHANKVIQQGEQTEAQFYQRVVFSDVACERMKMIEQEKRMQLYLAQG